SSGEFLSYTRSAEEAVAAVQTGARQAAVLVRPTPGAAVRDVALAGESLPQKSTYYWPKLLTGLVMSDLDSPVGLCYNLCKISQGAADFGQNCRRSHDFR